MASTLRCPICKKEVSLNDPNMPFCSDRCRLIDIGNWADEKYVISKPAQRDDLAELEQADDDFGDLRP